ncbi:hypothetical protein PsYK624_052140 [Phanerochaete sordida]|uniref:Uncharacterized protein n=1 Tax=Phanerochaete sordida TaxID=48140 RepID=A0A9P3G7A8_9APHY|nr:hypothetical protein PsYK624_052140 [Phanerochaete sordida]
MVDWGSPEVIGICLVVTEKTNLYFTGIFTWHFVVTFRNVEWQLLTRKIRWRWSYLYYFGGRYFLLGFQLPLHEVLQPVAFEVLAITGCMISVFASGNLLFRVIAIWREHRLVVALLVLLGMGHWIMVFAQQIPTIARSHGDFIPNPDTHPKISSNSSVPFFMYTFGLDLLILVLTIAGLLRQRAARASKLWRMLYRQGIMYFIVTFVVQLPTVIFAWDTESACMIGAFSMPGLVSSVMASSYAVTSLLALPHAPEPESLSVPEKPSIDISLPTHRSPRLSTNIALPMSVDSSQTPSSLLPHLELLRCDSVTIPPPALGARTAQEV